MAIPYFSPGWFFGYDVILELTFAIILFIVLLFAHRVYKTTSQRQVQIFGIGITFLMGAYVVQSIFNFLTVYQLHNNISFLSKAQYYLVYQFLGTYSNMLLMNVGLILILFMTFRTENYKILAIMLATSLLSMLMCDSPFNLFSMLVTIYLIFIAWYFVRNYVTNRNKKTLLVAVAFIFLLLANAHFIFSINHQIFYVLGHLLELIAYVFILWNFYLVRKHDKKKRKA
jgi:hypothetical protein